jgi:hypothetical protein
VVKWESAISGELQRDFRAIAKVYLAELSGFARLRPYYDGADDNQCNITYWHVCFCDVTA